MELGATAQRHGADGASVAAGIVGVTIDQAVATNPSGHRIAQLAKRYVRGWILVLPEVADRDVTSGGKELAQTLIVVRMRMRENDGRDRIAVQSERIEIRTQCFRGRTAIDEHRRAAILDDDGVALSHVEHAHDELGTWRLDRRFPCVAGWGASHTTRECDYVRGSMHGEKPEG